MQKEKEKINENQYNFEAKENTNSDPEYTYAVVMRCTTRQSVMIQDFLEANNIKIKYAKLSPGFLKIVPVAEGTRQ